MLKSGDAFWKEIEKVMLSDDVCKRTTWGLSNETMDMEMLPSDSDGDTTIPSHQHRQPRSSARWLKADATDATNIPLEVECDGFVSCLIQSPFIPFPKPKTMALNSLNRFPPIPRISLPTPWLPMI